MQLKGWVRTSLIDYPDHIATVLFTGGCNFRCPMCHNADLVLHPETLPDIAIAEVLAYLEQRAGRLTGVVLTGGEPTLQSNLAEFLSAVQALGYAVKLDTNGYRPDVLAELLRQRLLDYIAMDVKAPPEKYTEIAGVPNLAIDRIVRSLDALHDGGIAYEVRTTIMPWLTGDDIAALAQWLAARLPPHGPRQWILQPFQAQHTLDACLRHATPYTPEHLHALAERARRWVQAINVR
jgi:pyruvate formate lyase activating enzyme